MTTQTPPESPLSAQDMTPDPITPEEVCGPLESIVKAYRFDVQGSKSWILLQFTDDAETEESLNFIFREALDAGWTIFRTNDIPAEYCTRCGRPHKEGECRR